MVSVLKRMILKYRQMNGVAKVRPKGTDDIGHPLLKKGNCLALPLKKGMYCIIVLLSVSAQRSIAQTTPAAAAAVPFTITELWQKVTAKSKAVNIKQLELLESKEEVKNAKVSRLPDVNLDGEFAKLSNLPQFENGIFHGAAKYPISHTSYNLAASVYFNLYQGGQANRRIGAQKINVKISEQQRDLSASETRLLASAYYLDVLRSRAFQDLLSQDIDEQNKVLVQIKAIYKNGIVLKSDVLRAELKLSKQQLQVDEIKNDIAIASQKINLLIGQDENTLIEPAEPFLPDTMKLPAYETLVAQAATGAPEINISKQERNLSNLQVKDVKSNLLPHVGLFANYAYNYPQGRFYPYVLSLYGLGMVGIKASLPLSALFKNKHQLNIATLGVQKSGLAHLDVEDRIKNQLKEAYLRFQEDLERIRVSKNNIVQATENLRIVKNSYINQTSLITDYLDADVQLLQSKFDLSAARIAAQLQYYQLQKIIGTL
jgi:outer membrane protein